MVRNHRGATFIFQSVYHPSSSPEFNSHLVQHGDGVKDIALTVEDARAIYEYSIAHGAVSVQIPTELTD